MINEKIKNLRKSKNMSQQKLADLVGVSQASIQKIERGLINNPRYLKQIAKALNTSEEFLRFGVDTSTNIVSFELLNIKDYKGSDLTKFDKVHDVFTVDRDWFIEVFKKEPTLTMKIVFAQCESMQPTFKQGDFLLVDTADTTLNDGVYIFKVADQLFIKRLQLLPGKILAISDNKKYESFELPSDAVIVAKVIDLWKHDTP